MSGPTLSTQLMNRRAFLAAAAAASGAALSREYLDLGPVSRANAKTRSTLKKSLKMGMIADKDADGKTLSVADRLRIAANAGFVSVEPDTVFDADRLASIESGARDAGLTVDAIVCSTHWSSPLSDPDPAVFEKTMAGMRQSLQNAKDLGADMVLLVPAVVNPKVQYFQAWSRSVDRVKQLADDAERAGITIGIENVWNKFLLSPLEARHYISEIDSDRVRFWFDVGNVVLFGYPQDWIRTLGPLIARVDVKDFKSDSKQFVPLLDGSVDWPEVMRAFDEIGYEGYFAAEVDGGDEAYLREFVSERMDKIIAMD